ncbi:MAG: TolC family protein [Candidatus Protistobacter heckmanni]|nr:TolC family protein [Candidatus Protistobacter heckmanni]
MRFPRLKRLPALLVLAGFSLCQAQTSTAPVLAEGTPAGLEQLFSELKLNNPQVNQVRQSYLAAKALVPQIAAPNNPQIGFAWSQTPANRPLALNQAQSMSFSVSQSIPFPGKKALAAEIANDQAEAVDAQRDALVLQLYGQLAASYYQAVTMQRQIAVQREAVARLEQIKQITRIRYSNNAAAYVDYLNAQVAQSAAQNDQFAMERQYELAVQNINVLIGRDPSNPLALQKTVPPAALPAATLYELEQRSLASHPAIKASRLQVEAAEKGVRLARKGYLPDFNVVFSSTSGDPNGNTGTHPFPFRSQAYGLENDLVIPLWFFTKEKYGVDQAVYTKLSAEAGDQSTRQQILQGVDAAHSNLRVALQQLSFLKDRQLPEARTAFRLALTNYSTGQAAFNDLLTAQTSLRTAELSVAQGEAAAVQAHAALLAAVGVESF